MPDLHIPEDCRYTKHDEWVRPEGDELVIGVTDYAQQQLGDVVFVELPEPGTPIVRDASFGVIESVKAVSDLYAAVDGEVVAVNSALEEKPELVNESCYGDGWILRVSGDVAQLDTLMDAAAYRAYVDGRAD